MKRYKDLTLPVGSNLYGVATDSILDAPTYMDIMRASGLQFDEVNPNAHGLKNCTAAISCTERIIDQNASQQYFEQQLSGHVKYNTEVSALIDVPSSGYSSSGQVILDKAFVKLNDGSQQRYDFAVNCTSAHVPMQTNGALKSEASVFQPCVMLVYRLKNKAGASTDCLPSRIVVDGNFVSVFPRIAKDGTITYTLSSVEHTPLGNFETAAAARECIAAFEADPSRVMRKRELMESAARTYFLDFDKDLVYDSFFTSIKTKTRSASDYRACITHLSPHCRVASAYACKITGIFPAEQKILAWLADCWRRRAGGAGSSAKSTEPSRTITMPWPQSKL